MPVLKELVAYLVIERFYKEMATLPDSSVTEGRRTIRTMLVIDEAHNYLRQRNIFLQHIIREGGCSCLLREPIAKRLSTGVF
jgi:hypothetical protein